jgi:hypothetical protein
MFGGGLFFTKENPHGRVIVMLSTRAIHCAVPGLCSSSHRMYAAVLLIVCSLSLVMVFSSSTPCSALRCCSDLQFTLSSAASLQRFGLPLGSGACAQCSAVEGTVGAVSTDDEVASSVCVLFSP